MKDTLLKIFLVVLLLLIISLVSLIVYKIMIKEPNVNDNIKEEIPSNDNQDINKQSNFQNENNQGSADNQGVLENDASSELDVAKTNFMGVLKSAELGYAKALQQNSNISDGTCVMNETLSVTCTNGAVIQINDVAPIEGTVTLTKGATLVTSGNDLKFGNYYCSGNTTNISCSLNKSA